MKSSRRSRCRRFRPIEAFEEDLMAGMTGRDAEVPRKMDRLEELAERIESAMDGVGGR